MGVARGVRVPGRVCGGDGRARTRASEVGVSDPLPSALLGSAAGWYTLRLEGQTLVQWWAYGSKGRESGAAGSEAEARRLAREAEERLS